jgi:CRP/FNR family cyclic AMP-dependent transcriptional regulator
MSHASLPSRAAHDGFLATLRGEDRAALERTGGTRAYEPGASLFREGEPSRAVFLVTKGRVRVWQTAGDGTDVVLAVVATGGLLGELSALDGQPRSASAVAVELVTAVVVPADRFVDFLQTRPGVAVHLLRLVARRLRDADGRHAEVVSQDVEGRLARRLLELAGENGDGRGIRGVTHDELAGWVGASREAISRTLAGMRKAGWLTTGRAAIDLRDLEALRRRAE